MKLTGSKAIVQSLLEHNVRVCFGYPGGAIMTLYDALYDEKRIKHVLVRHEQGAAHAAQGYAHESGKVGVCITTSGPGAMNTVTGLADAMMDSEPVVCITGQVHSSVVGTDAFQEVDVIGVTAPITKWNYQITDAKEIPEVFTKAFTIASTGRPGPVVIDITKNAQIDELDYKAVKKVHIPGYQPNLYPNMKQMRIAARIINEAERPMMIFGHGIQISHAEKEALACIEKSGMPFAATMLALGAFSVKHPQYVGMVGMHGNYSPNILTNKADVIFAVGMRFDDRVTGRLANYAPQAKIVHIDIDPAELNKNVKADVPIVADAKEALRELLPFIKNKRRNAWIKEFRKLDKKEEQEVIKEATKPSKGKIRMAEVVHLLSQKTEGKAVIVADVGQNQMASARYYEFDQDGDFVTSGGSGTMGYALPASIGAKIATPEKPVIAIIGDGGFQMTIQELGTIYQEKLPIKIVVLNNGYLGMVRQWQQLFFNKRYAATPLTDPDFIQVAKGFHIPGKRVLKRKDLSSSLDEMLCSKSPYILEIIEEREDNIFPMIPAGAAVDEIRLS